MTAIVGAIAGHRRLAGPTFPQNAAAADERPKRAAGRAEVFTLSPAIYAINNMRVLRY